MRAPFLALAAAALAACGGGSDPPPPVSVGLSFQAASCTDFCASIDDCPLQCNSEVGVFITDGQTGAVIDSSCVPIIGNMDQTLASLAGYVEATAFDVLRGRSVSIDVVVYPGTPGCPEPDFVDGRWELPGDVPPQYAGRSAVYTVDDALTSIVVPVECIEPVEMCETIETLFRTSLFDLATLDEDPELAPNTVDIRTAFRVPTGMAPPADEEFVLTPDVELDHAALSTWEATATFTQADECIGTLVTRIGVGLVPTVGSCDGAVQGAQILASSYHLDKDSVDGILDALGLETLPDEGLVVGRIASQQTIPDATKTVRAVTPTTTMTITYLETDGSGVFTVVPKGSWFVITDMGVDLATDRTGKCCDTLEIVDELGAGTGFFSPFPVGLIRGIVMAVVVTS